MVAIHGWSGGFNAQRCGVQVQGSLEAQRYYGMTRQCDLLSVVYSNPDFRRIDLMVKIVRVHPAALSSFCAVKLLRCRAA